MVKPFIAEGTLWLYSQEGGYAADGWELRDGDERDELAVTVREHFGAKRLKYPDERAGDVPMGRVRITIERIDWEPLVELAKEKDERMTRMEQWQPS